ncbi:diacylglycerol kinase family protein, partial [Mycoplasmopsis anatis]|uniref:diacylglycerol kinase family protein n=1 Tax=Mycoplasmopsis anatis TaxID=171279 RepID=UPI001F3EAC9E
MVSALCWSQLPSEKELVALDPANKPPLVAVVFLFASSRLRAEKKDLKKILWSFLRGLTLSSIIEWMIIFLLIGGMFSLELLNTAIEHTVDLITDKHHPLAKAAKDAAAGAVCVFAVISCIIGLLIFLTKL